jgi:hypothetical protein
VKARRYCTTKRCAALFLATTSPFGFKAKFAAMFVGIQTNSDRILTHLIGVRLGKLNATPLKLPAITDAASIASALAVITGKIAAGELDLNAANSLIALLETHRKSIETVELEAPNRQSAKPLNLVSTKSGKVS